MFRFIKEFLEFRKMKHQREMSCKKFVLTQAMIKFYEDLHVSSGGLELPPFICAHNAMNALKTDKAVNQVYKKFAMKGLV